MAGEWLAYGELGLAAVGFAPSLFIAGLAATGRAKIGVSRRTLWVRYDDSIAGME